MTTVELYRGNNKEHYFRMVNDNGMILLSSEGFHKKDNALRGVDTVKEQLHHPEQIVKRQTRQGKHYFSLKKPDGQVICRSTLFESADLRDHCIDDLKEELPQSELKEVKGN